MRRFIAALLTGIITGGAAMAVAPSPAQADPWPFAGCYDYMTYTYYSYPGVYAGAWEDYLTDNSGSNCWDINVEDATTGHITVRVQFCPKPPPAQQFTCYASGWGTTPASGIGCAEHWYNFPNGGTNGNFYYRMETNAQEIFRRWI